MIDPISLKESGSVAADSITKVGTNNTLRRTLRTELARFSLASPDVATRMQAVREISQLLDENTLALLRDRSVVERNAAVRKEIATGLSLGALDGGDAGARRVVVEALPARAARSHSRRMAVCGRSAAQPPDGGIGGTFTAAGGCFSSSCSR